MPYPENDLIGAVKALPTDRQEEVVDESDTWSDEDLRELTTAVPNMPIKLLQTQANCDGEKIG